MTRSRKRTRKLLDDLVEVRFVPETAIRFTRILLKESIERVNNLEDNQSMIIERINSLEDTITMIREQLADHLTAHEKTIDRISSLEEDLTELTKFRREDNAN